MKHLRLCSFFTACLILMCTCDFYKINKINADEVKSDIVLEDAMPVRGDLNNDGKLNIFDYQRYIKLLLNGDSSDEDKYRSDLNSDGIIDAKDLASIKKHLCGTEKIWSVSSMPLTDGNESLKSLNVLIQSEMTGVSSVYLKRIINHSGADESFDRLLNGETELIFTESLTDEQRLKAEKLNVKLNMVTIAYLPDDYFYIRLANYGENINNSTSVPEKSINIILTDKASDKAKEFVRWVVSDEGQFCLAEAGYISIKNELLSETPFYGRSLSDFRLYDESFVVNGKENNNQEFIKANVRIQIKRKYFKNQFLWYECFNADDGTFLGWALAYDIKKLNGDIHEQEYNTGIISEYKTAIKKYNGLGTTSQYYDVNKDGIPEMLIFDKYDFMFRVYSYSAEKGAYEIFSTGPKSRTDFYSCECKIVPETGDLIVLIKIKREGTNNIEIQKIARINCRDGEIIAYEPWDGNKSGLREFYEKSDVEEYLPLHLYINESITGYLEGPYSMVPFDSEKILVCKENTECINSSYVHGAGNKKVLDKLEQNHKLKCSMYSNSISGTWYECYDYETGEYRGWINAVNLKYLSE